MAEKQRSAIGIGDADLPSGMTRAEAEVNRFTEAALERHKFEGIELAVHARWVALAIIAVMLPFLNPNWEILYYEVLLLLLAAVGLVQRRIARVGKSRAELVLLFVDLALMTFILVSPNPLSERGWPPEMVYRFGGFSYLYVILAAGTLAYSWRTITAIGTWTSLLWMFAAGCIWWFGAPDQSLAEAARTAFGNDPDLLQILDPNSLNFDIRFQEIMIFLIVAVILSQSVRRFNKLLLNNAALERERENLSRYFSPNVVDELSRNDEPLKQIRTHNVAVLFVDIVGFTSFAAERHPEEVIKTLREFHGRMEEAVFRHGGTLDKYLGDGLMATFGTPFAGEKDATNALNCASDMISSVAELNERRVAKGDPSIEAKFGLHYGPVVLGDIGANRLEFAVIGNTVNVASRIEALTRELSVQAAASDNLREQVIRETGSERGVLSGFERRPDQTIRGVDQKLTLWTLH